MAEFKELSPDAPAAAKLMNWVDNRFPASKLYKEHMSEYYAPKNFNFWYVFGSLALLVLVIQIVTGIFLTMHYKPDAALAFGSVEYIMRDVPWGWLIRYMHSTGASAFFVVVYLHMFRGLIYGSYRKPRELVWIFGCAIFLALMAEAFMGYLLPWGQMSYWGAQVIVNLFAAIPFIGPDLALLIRGDYVVGDATLNRFFAFHVIAVPLVLLGLVVAHIIALHEVGSNNPDGVEIKAKKDAAGLPLDGIPFHPYYTVHDIFAVSVFLMIFSAIIFFAPEAGGYFLEYNNFIPADSLKTPAHIAPVWYFTPYYSMLRAITGEMAGVLGIIVIVSAVLAGRKLQGFLRLAVLVVAIAAALMLGLLPFIANMVGTVLPAVGAGLARALTGIAAPLAGVPFIGEVWAMLIKGIDAKFWGVVVMGGAVIILFFLPWLDSSAAKSIRYRPTWHSWLYGIFVVNFLVLGYLGINPPSLINERVSQLGTLFYFGFFLLMPWWSQLGTFRPVPDRVTFAAH
ncbi:cytochrome bc complex cytochrome b subunit [Polaromonas sp. A23]|uniref:cytochrome b n=1 Tax=Polaromonas sp. A23 TaxID=1944133 RepID=UPI000986DDED|nr:cytochrome bc complex cytochrome b subunit [Polaromonas sp. A23]